MDTEENPPEDNDTSALIPRQNRAFFSRYNKIISLVYGSVTIAASILFFFIYRDHYDAIVQETNLRLLEQTRAFNNVLRVRYDAVKAMQRQARKFILHEFDLFDTSVKLRNSPNGKFYFLPIKDGVDVNYGVIIGEGSVDQLGGDVLRELQMAYSLTPLVNVLKNQIQSVVSFHYTSQNRFFYVYPWQSDAEIAFRGEIYKKSFFTRAMPKNNRPQGVIWTDVFTSSNNTSLITCAAPVANNKELFGVVAIDFTLDSVDFFVESLHHGYGHFAIVNDYGTIIAHLDRRQQELDSNTKIENLLPSDLVLNIQDGVFEESLNLVGNYWVFVASTSFAPWKIIYFSHKDEITLMTLKQILPGLLMVLLFTTLFLIGANRLIAREFIEPAKLLVDHITNPGEVNHDVINSVRPPWDLWFNAVSQVFEENRALVEKLERHIHKLDEKVAQRTKDLSHNNMQLKQALLDLKKAQAQIITQEKLAGLGALTAGIAHEIRNPLNFMINFAETSKIFGEEMTEAIEESRDALDPHLWKTLHEKVTQLNNNMTKIEEHGRRADAIVHSMLIHARGGEEQLREVVLNELIEENIVLGLASFKQKGFLPTVTRLFDSRIETVIVYPQDLGRVLLNIINNACYALHKKSNNGNDFTPELTVSTLDRDKEFEVRIRDNGPGIPESEKNKIFDPFFTTKPSGEGTGLGLSLCFDIVVNQHGGSFTIDTELGEFTEFVIVMPKKTLKALERD